MRVPPFERYRGWMKGAAYFLCGAIVGAALFNGFMHGQLDYEIVRNYELQAQLEDYRKLETERLRDESRRAVIRSVSVFVEEPADREPIGPEAQKELKRRLKDDLSIFLGRSVYDIGTDAAWARRLINGKDGRRGKVYSDIEGKDYVVRLTTVLVASGALQAWVEAREQI